MNNVYSIASIAFGIGFFSGYFLRKNWFIVQSLLKKQNKQIKEENKNEVKKKKFDAKVQDFTDYKSQTESSESTKSSLKDLLKLDEDFKMVLIVRNDLKMGKGKVAAQCSHATLGCYEEALKNPKVLSYWLDCGQAKVVLKCDEEKELIELKKKATEKGLICSLIRDAGRTQIAAGSRTVLGIGPGPAKLIDEVSGHLKLF